VNQLQKAGIPVVCCHRRVEGVSTPLVSIPYRELGHLAARSLLERGHRRIAFFAPQRTATAMLYGDGLRAGLADGQAQIPEGCEFYGPDALINPAEYESEIALALRGMLSLPERPTAIFASFDSLAELIFLVLGQMGVAVPQEMSIVGLGGVSRTTPIMRQLTSVTIDEVQAGCLAVDLLEQMNRGELSLDDDSVHPVRTGLSLGQTLGVCSGV
jgi:DNA-binding LacI/PurR family transcriptional regulator